MKKLLLLSDLWGLQQSEWIQLYQSNLQDHFEITIYDICQLGEIDLSKYEAKAIHDQFINGKMDLAVNTLIQKEKSSVGILAFSMGATIAWKAIQKGLKADFLYAISATRLRYETEAVNSQVTLIYGKNDPYRPDKECLKHLQLKAQLIPNQGHELYRQKLIATKISTVIIKNHH